MKKMKASAEGTQMIQASSAQSTRVASWGNSEAIRIPQSILRAAGLAPGDRVEIVVNERHNIEVFRKAPEHRRVRPAEGITFDTLFAGYNSETCPTSEPAWPDEDMQGDEFEAWSL